MKYKVITLSGSLRFWDDFLKIASELSTEGNIVLAPFRDLREDSLPEEAKIMHDELHQQRIDMSDELYVINKGGYIGKSTKKEIRYAITHGKEIHFMERPDIDTIFDIISEVKDKIVLRRINKKIRELTEVLLKELWSSYMANKANRYNFIESTSKIHPIQTKMDIILTLVQKRFLQDDKVDARQMFKDSLEDAWENTVSWAKSTTDDTDPIPPSECPYTLTELVYETSSELLHILLKIYDEA